MKNVVLYEKFKDYSQFELTQAFLNACSFNQIDIVEYLTLNTDRKPLNPNLNDNNPLVLACTYGSLDVVKFLLTHPKMKEQVDLHAKEDSAFKLACRMRKNEITDFLINDYWIEKTPAITKFLEKNNFPKIKEAFKKRATQMTLDLSSEDNFNKKATI